MSEQDIEEREEFFKKFGEILVRRHGQNYSQYKKTGEVIKDETGVNFGQTLRNVRVKATLSPEEVAAKTGLSKARIIALESGLIKVEEIKPQWVVRLAEALEVEVEVFKGLLQQRLEAERPRRQNFSWMLRRDGAISILAIIALFAFIIFWVIPNQTVFQSSSGESAEFQRITKIATASSIAQMTRQSDSMSETLTVKPTRLATPTPTTAPVFSAQSTLSTIPTASPPPSPTQKPTSTPEVMVIVPNLNLRAGPGVDYEVIGSLVEGDTLDIQGRTAGKDWLEVSTTSNFEGWVSAEYVQINEDPEAIPIVEPPAIPTTPTSSPNINYLSPTLVSPDNGVSTRGIFPSLVWRWEGELGEDEFFEVRMWHETVPYHAALGWVKVPQFDYGVSGERSGKYYWTVVVVKGKNPKLKDWIAQSEWPYPVWDGELVAELSSESEPRFFLFTARNYFTGAASTISEPAAGVATD